MYLSEIRMARAAEIRKIILKKIAKLSCTIDPLNADTDGPHPPTTLTAVTARPMMLR